MGLSLKRSIWVAVCALIGSLVWLAGLVMHHGPGIPATFFASQQNLESWQVVRGSSSQAGNPGIAELDPAGEFFAVSPETFNADQWPILTLEAHDYPLNYVLMLAWQRVGGEQAYFTRLQVPDGNRQRYLMGRFEGWTGDVSELVLYGYPQPQTSPPILLRSPVSFNSVGLTTDSWLGRLGALWTGWTAPDPWAMLSVSSLGKYPDLDEGTGLVPAVAGVVLIACLSLLLAGGLRGQSLARGILSAVVAGTILLQWQFTRSLFLQVTETRSQFGSLTEEQRLRFQFDRELIDLAGAARPWIDPADHVHIITDDRFFNLRAAWHLRPANVSTFFHPSGRHQGKFKAGDLIFIYRKPELVSMAGKRQVLLGGQRWAAEPLVAEPSGALLRLIEPQPG